MKAQARLFFALVLTTAISSCAQVLSYAGGGRVDSYVVQGRAPFWNGAGMVKIDDGAIDSWAEDGRPLPVATVQLPESVSFFVFDAASKPDGSLVACVNAKDREGRKGGLLYFIPPDRGEPKIVSTAPYVAAKVALAADGSIWTAGFDANLYAVRDKNTTIIRHFDAAGRLLAGFVKQSSFQERGFGLPGSGLGAFALSSSGTAGWCGAHAETYVEVRGGEEHDYPGVPMGAHEYVDGLAILSSGETIVSVTSGDPGAHLYSLDRSTNSWRAMPLPAAADAGDGARFLGQFGERLVLQSKNRADFRFVSASGAPVESK